MEERVGFARLAIEQGYPFVPFAAIGADDMLDVIVELHPRHHRRQHGDAADGDEEHERDAADRRHSLGEGNGAGDRRHRPERCRDLDVGGGDRRSRSAPDEDSAAVICLQTDRGG